MCSRLKSLFISSSFTWEAFCSQTDGRGLPVPSHVSFLGPDHFGELHRVTLQRHQNLYTLPVGETRPYFSFEGLAHRVSEAHVSDSAAVRHTSVANKWKTVHLLLHPDHNATQIRYNLTFQGEGDAEFTMSFLVAVDTRESPRVNASQPLSNDGGRDPKPTPTPEPAFPFSEVPEDRRGPKIRKKRPDQLPLAVDVPPVNASLLPAAAQSKLQELEEKLLVGDITVKGYNVSKAELLKPYLTPAGREPIVRPEPASEDGPEGRRSPYKDLEGEMVKAEPRREGEAKEAKEAKEATVVKGTRPEDTKPLLPVVIDEDIREVATPKQPSQFLSGTAKAKAEPGGAAPGGAPAGRKLKHLITSDRGFLPWERRRYFQEVLEVRRRAGFFFPSPETFARPQT